MEWTRTRSVLTELGNLLTCVICNGYLKDPCTLENCDHHFCRKCIEESLGGRSKCPECGAFSWLKDLRVNHELATTVMMTLKLQSLIGINSEVENWNLEVPEDDSHSDDREIHDNYEEIDDNHDEEIDDNYDQVLAREIDHQVESNDNNHQHEMLGPGNDNYDDEVNEENNYEEAEDYRQNQERAYARFDQEIDDYVQDVLMDTGAHISQSKLKHGNERKWPKRERRLRTVKTRAVKQPNDSDSDDQSIKAGESTNNLKSRNSGGRFRENSTENISTKTKKPRKKTTQIIIPRSATNPEIEDNARSKMHGKHRAHVRRSSRENYRLRTQSTDVTMIDKPSDNEENSATNTTQLTNQWRATRNSSRKYIKLKKKQQTDSDRQSDNEDNNYSIKKDTKKLYGRSKKLKKKPTEIESSTDKQSENEEPNGSIKTDMKQRTSARKFASENNRLRKQQAYTDTDTQSDNEERHASLKAGMKQRLNVRKSCRKNGKSSKHTTASGSDTCRLPEDEGSNASIRADVKQRTSVKSSLSKRNNKQRGDVSSDKISGDQEDVNEKVNIKQCRNVRKPTRSNNKLSKQQTHHNSGADFSSDNQGIDGGKEQQVKKPIEVTTSKEDKKLRKQQTDSDRDEDRQSNHEKGDASCTTHLQNDVSARRSYAQDDKLSEEETESDSATNIQFDSEIRSSCAHTQPTSTKEAVENMSEMSENTNIYENGQTNLQKSNLARKKSAVDNTISARSTALARSCSKSTTRSKINHSFTTKGGRKTSKENAHKEYWFKNQLNPTCKSVPKMTSDTFDFTQEEDPFHFSLTEQNNKNDLVNNNDDRIYDIYDDNGDYQKSDYNLHSDDGVSECVTNTATRGHKSRGSKTNAILNDGKNESKILQNSEPTIRRAQNKMNSNVSAENTKKKVHFTVVKDRSTNPYQNDKIEVNKDANKHLRNVSKFEGHTGKENVRLNIKRRRVSKKNHNIRRLVVKANHVDTRESSSDDASVPQKKIRTPSSSCSQNSWNGTVSSQNSQKSSRSQQKIRNKKGETPLHLAAIKGDYNLARKLIDEGADPNVKDHAGWTPLHEACNHGHVEIVRLFLDHDALINIPGLDNDTPLHDAVANSRLKVVELLVARGANLTARNKQGLLPMNYAVTPAMKAALNPRDVSSPSTKPSENIENKTEPCREKQVILGTALGTQEQVLLENCVEHLGGTLVREFDESVTHVVTSVNENGHCARTIKYMCGILAGRWIVGFEWIKDSFRQKKWLDENVYEVEGSGVNTRNVTRKARLNILQQMPRLLDGCSFFLRGVFNPPTASKQDLVRLIQLGGGKLLQREPKVKDDDVTSLPSSPVLTSALRQPQVAYHALADSTLSCCTEFILYDPLSCDQPKIVHSPLLRTAPVTWLMDCISSFQLLDIPDEE